MNIPFFGKKKGIARAETREDKFLEYLIAPPSIMVGRNEIKIEKYHRILAAIGYPRLVEPGWLTRLLEMNVDFDLSIHIAPYPIETTIALLSNELKKQKTDIYALKQKGKIIPQVLINQHHDTLKLLEEIQKGTEKMFDIAIYVDVKEYDKKNLDHVSDRVKAIMNSLMIVPKLASLQMKAGLQSVLPIQNDSLKLERNITSSAAAACFPFATTSLQASLTGIMLGFNQLNNIPIIIDPYKLSNPNMLILGTSGGGKSYTVKLMIMREFLRGVDINIIDPQAEYSDLVTVFGGRVIRMAADSNNVLNPLDLMDQTFDEKILSLLAFFRVMMGRVTEEQQAILDDAIKKAYEGKGITDEPATWKNEPPLLEDIYNEVLPLTKSEREVVSKPALGIINRIKIYVHGPLRLMNQHTKIELDNRLISFDIRDIPDVGKGTMMFLILEYVYKKMKGTKQRKILVIDEAWTVLAAAEEAEYVMRIVKTSRKFNLALTLITQDVEDLVNTHAGRAVLANTATKILARQDTTVIASIVKEFHLSEPEKIFLSTAQVGNALLLAQNTRVPMYIMASADEDRIITTNPDELMQMDRKKKQMELAQVKREEKAEPKTEEMLEIGIDPSKRVHFKDLLTDRQLEVLENSDFDEVYFPALDDTRERFLIRNDTGDDNYHYVLHHLIYEEVIKYTDDAYLNYELLPEVTFKTPDNKLIAIEIEADEKFTYDESQIETKKRMLAKYDDYFFAVADDELIDEYIKQFQDAISRTAVKKRIASYFKPPEEVEAEIIQPKVEG